MNEEQLKAIKSLERAFKKCKEVGISFYGMDEDLHGISTIKMDDTLPASCEWNDKMHDSLNASGIIINTCRSYKNSGGF